MVGIISSPLGLCQDEVSNITMMIYPNIDLIQVESLDNILPTDDYRSYTFAKTKRKKTTFLKATLQVFQVYQSNILSTIVCCFVFRHTSSPNTTTDFWWLPTWECCHISPTSRPYERGLSRDNPTVNKTPLIMPAISCWLTFIKDYEAHPCLWIIPW